MRVTVDVYGRDPLWFQVDAAFEPLLSDRADHVAIAMLLPAMKAGHDLHVGGRVTDVLLHQLNHDLQVLLRAILGDLQAVTVTADEAVTSAAPAPGVGGGFSGGVDSLAVVRSYLLDADVPDALRMTHLFNYNVGSHGPDGNALWRARCAPLAQAAAAWGVPLVRVDSNLDAHYPKIGFLESVSVRNAAVHHLLGGGIGRVYVGSSQPFWNARVDPCGDLALADTMLLPLLSTPAMTLSSANSDVTRVEKTLALVGRPEAQYLDVCVDFDPVDGRNCGQCTKCLRTMLTLEIAGHLDGFIPDVFPREPYLVHRASYLGEVLGHDDAISQDLKDLAASRSWRWGATAHGRGALVRAREASSRTLHRAAQTPPGRVAKRLLLNR